VQGVGFRPFVFRLATAHGLTGWVLNGAHGVDIHVEGSADALDAFARDLSTCASAASIASVDNAPAASDGWRRSKSARAHP
jgi:hydrogenase maturation protein HypF